MNIMIPTSRLKPAPHDYKAVQPAEMSDSDYSEWCRSRT
jgi:hypothetical protein